MRVIFVLPLIALVGGCGAVPQYSSGAEYIAARPEFNAASGTDLDRAVEHAANVEPLLRFPAKIGLARISGGRFVPVPPDEADAWIAFAKSHGQYGELVPVSPLVGDLAMAGSGYENRSNYNYGYGSGVNPLIPIRLAAARQHIDAVLVYAVGGDSSDKATPLTVMDLTIIGAYLVPSRGIKGTAITSGLLFDAHNGYPYGTVTASSSQTGFVPEVGSTDRSKGLQVDAQIDAVGKLTSEVDKLLISLGEEMKTRDLKAADAKATPAPHAAAAATPPRKP